MNVLCPDEHCQSTSATRCPQFCRDRGWMCGRAGALCLSSSPYVSFRFREANGSHLREGQAQGPHFHSAPPPVPTGRRSLHSLFRSFTFTRTSHSSLPVLIVNVQ